MADGVRCGLFGAGEELEPVGHELQHPSLVVPTPQLGR
jgi:hypothetical protein